MAKNDVYHWWTTYALKSKSMLEMHFSFDLTNSKKTQSLGENDCRQKCLDKSLLINMNGTTNINFQ